MREVTPTNFQFPSRTVSGSTLTMAGLGVVAIAALYFGREVFMPIALAVLLSFVLAPLVRVLRRCYLPRIIAVILVTLLAFAAIVGLGALMVSQVTQFASELPRYQSTLREKIQSLRGAAAGSGTFERASEVLQDLRKEIESPNDRTGLPSGGRPLPVEVREPDPGALLTAVAIVKPLTSPLTTAAIVFVFLIFILMQREDLRNRLVRLAGAHDLQRTTTALDDAGQRLSRLFLAQLALNASFGLVIGVGLWMIGLPSAPLWGMLAMIMRFLPYIGAMISAILPLLLAAAVGPGWTMFLMTAALFAVVEPIVGHVIEPLVYGRSAGLSPFAVVVSATFWTWLWGPIGLVLATPLTICLVLLGRHVDRLKFLDVMFGDQPPLTPAELVYHRLLARDPVEPTEQAWTYLEDKPLISYYDDILLKGLKLAQVDAERGLLDEGRMQLIRDGVAEIIDDLDPHEDKPEVSSRDAEADADAEEHSAFAKLGKAESAPEALVLPDGWRAEKSVLCIPGLGLLDEAAALIVAHLIQKQGIGAQAEQADALSMSRIFSWDTKDTNLICLCYIENVTTAQIRYAVRRVRRRAPDVIVVVALLADPDGIDREELSSNKILVKDSLPATIDQIVELAHRSSQNHGSPRTEALTRGPIAATAV